MKPTLIAAIALTLCACSPEAKETTATQAQELVNHVTYARKGAACFAVLTTKRLTLRADLTQSVSITYIPCEVAGL